MDKGKYLEERANYARQARFLRFIVFLLAVAVIVNGVFVYTSNVRERVILVPVLPEGEVYVAGKDASDSYIKSMASLAFYFRLTYTPANVASQFNGFLKLLSASYYKEVFDEMSKLKDEIISAQMISAFFPEEFVIRRDLRVVEVKGKLQQWVEGKAIVNEERKGVLKYSIDFGKFAIEKFKLCKPNEECKL